jgi:uncharacterized SAM-binding protein YcdF (DUF218 family)
MQVLTPPLRRRRLRRWLQVSAAAAVVIVVAVLTRVTWMPFLATVLTVNDPAASCDVLIVPSGQTLTRVPAAARLLRAGYARSVFAASSGDFEQGFLLMGMHVTDTELVWRVVDRERIPRDAVTVATQVTSTYEDAVAFREYARAHNVRSATIVTSHLHSRRARWTYRRVLRDLPVHLSTVEVPQSDFPVDRWWRSEPGLLTVADEYLKFAFYLTHY